MSSERKLLIQKLQARLNEANAHLDILRARIQEADADRRMALRERVRQLEQRRDSVRDRLGGLVDASDEAFADLRAGAEEALDALSNAFGSAIARYR